MERSNEFPSVPSPDQLLIHRLLDRPLSWAPGEKIIYRDRLEITYLELHERLQRLAGALSALGVGAGDRVGVLDWDSHRYLECFFAVPMLGAVLHTINVRLSPEQILFTINHAGDKVLLVHADFLPLVQQLAPKLRSVTRCIVLQDGPATPVTAPNIAGEYEERLAAASSSFEFPEFDEHRVATLFYTTGTTGDPKGVFFSHRQIVLHTLSAGLALAAVPEPVTLRQNDVYMPLTPMFHVHAWGVPYLATLLGLRQVYPGRYEPQMLLQLLEQQRVTVSHCVPTILQMLLHHPASGSVDWSRWKVIIGGSALPKGLAQAAMERGIRIMGGYGLSETCPIISIAQLKPADTEAEASRKIDVTTCAGFPLPLVRAAALGAGDSLLPPGRENVGELGLRAPWLTGGYFKDESRSREVWRGGWLHTGDIAYRDSDGYIRITDRLKDVIKVGGEWISSLELESALSQHEAVREVAVVGLADTKWGERPHAEVTLRDEQHGTITPKDLMSHLRRFIDDGLIHKRAILTEIRIVQAIPKTGVGKIDKRALRAQLQAEQTT